MAVPIPRPSVPEQRAIATALSDVDALLDGLDRLIAKKRDLKQATMQQLLIGQMRLPGFHGEWNDVQVRDVIASYFCGPSPTCEERHIQDEFEWGVLKTTAATKERGWDWTKHKTLPRVFWNKPHLELKRGDVIVTKAGPRHRVGVACWVDYVPPHIIVSGKMIGLRPRPDKVVPLMLAAAISTRVAQAVLDQRTTGMAESQVNFENVALLETPVRIPLIDEQRAIAAVLSDMDAELVSLEARRDKTRDLKQAMMQELLTGKTRLVHRETVNV
jgi:type I restriction enzyme S subunit